MKKITLKGIEFEDFTNYKKAAMFLIFPKCGWKCEKDCGIRGICQNSALDTSPVYEWSIEGIIKQYLQSPLTEAVVCGGLEPFDSFNQLLTFIQEFRKVSQDDIVIYTGYTEKEIYDLVYTSPLSSYKNIIVKFGRYLPDSKEKYDEVLGVTLASENQYGKRVTEYAH